MLVVLVVSTAGAALLAPRPTPAPEEGETTTTATQEPSEGAADGSGRLIETTVQAASRRARVVRMRVGDQLELTVRTRGAVQVEIPRLGMIEDAAPDAPAHFSVLPSEAARYGVRVAGGREIAVIRVGEPGEQGRQPAR
jgi:hypothetical protein